MPKISVDYALDYAQNYQYNDTLIEITGGVAQLKSPYVLTDPYLSANWPILTVGLNSFTETSVLGSGTLVKYILSLSGQNKWHDGTSWIDSNGTIAQSNLASEIDTNAASLTSARARVKLAKIFMHTAGTDTPKLQNVNISYNFNGYATPDDVRAALVDITDARISDQQLATYIELGDEDINTYIQGQYTLPISDGSTLATLRSFTVRHAAYNVYAWLAARENSKISQFASDQYKKLMTTLENIRDGKMRLGGPSDLSIFDVSTANTNPTFNQGDVLNWHPDESIVELADKDQWPG